MFSNYLFFRVVRHSDHHLNAYKVYSTLSMNDKMPIFPCGMHDIVNLAIIPPLWYYTMNPLVEKAIEGKPVPKGHEEKVKWIAEALSLLNLILIWHSVYQVYTAGN